MGNTVKRAQITARLGYWKGETFPRTPMPKDDAAHAVFIAHLRHWAQVNDPDPLTKAARQAQRLFTPGNLCGCQVVELALWSGDETAILYDSVEEVRSRCAVHAYLTKPQALYDEVYHSHGWCWSSDECGCAVHAHWDDRQCDPITGYAELTPNERAGYTKRCKGHRTLTDPARHYAAALQHNRERKDNPRRVASAKDGMVPTHVMITPAEQRIMDAKTRRVLVKA